MCLPVPEQRPKDPAPFIINMLWKYGWMNREVYHSLNSTSNWTTWDQEMLRIHGGLTSIFGMNSGILVDMGALKRSPPTLTWFPSRHCWDQAVLWIPNRDVRCAYETMISLSRSEILSSLKLTVNSTRTFDAWKTTFLWGPGIFSGANC